jgi:acetyl-CoA C-acetyltransferase
MPDAVIVDAVRTPIGRAAKGSLKDVRADDLAAVPLRALVERNPEVDFAETGDIVMGCAFQLGEQGYNVGRNAQLLAGIDHHVPATTINRFCASSLQGIRMAFHAIAAGEGDQYVAAGVEAVSRYPAHPPFDPHQTLDGSEGDPYDVYIPMGITAENVAARCQVSREAQDEWAATSQQRAVAARDSGHFDREIVPVPLPDGTEVRRDDGPRPGTTAEVLGTLKPAFKPDGTVTAGNASQLSDGAAAVVVASGKFVEQSGAKPLARVVSYSMSGVHPKDIFIAPVPAVKMACEKAKLALRDIDLFELNEAFAAQMLACGKGLELDESKVNVHGGAVALGHPIGASGARVLTTLVHALHRHGKRYGLASLCLGGGNAVAMIVERV